MFYIVPPKGYVFVPNGYAHSVESVAKPKKKDTKPCVPRICIHIETHNVPTPRGAYSEWYYVNGDIEDHGEKNEIIGCRNIGREITEADIARMFAIKFM